ncbi:MAG: hypothetical protein ACREOA_01925 [Candidatus Dormibacteria bacterium]
MKMPLARAAGAGLAAATLALAGCGGTSGSVVHGPAHAILTAADQKALASSFEATFTGQLQVNLSGVKPSAGTSSDELALLQTEINAARLNGVIQFQSKHAVEVSVSLSPLLAQTLRVLDLDGNEYVFEDGKWYASSQTGSAGASAPAAGGLKAEIKSLESQLTKQAVVTNLGETQLAGQSVDHLRSTLSGSAANAAFAQMLSGMASQVGASATPYLAKLPAIESMLQFGQSSSDSYVLNSTGQLARTTVTWPMTINLAELATLLPTTTGLPSGSASLTFSFAANFSDYGKDFNLQKPSQLTPGVPPDPAGGLSAT